jgi:Fe2+ transport system protein FeoA
MICCPNCGYQMVDATRSRLASWLRKLWPQAESAKQAQRAVDRRPLPLSQAPMRVDLVVQSMDGLAPHLQARFSVLGLLPGARVQLLQRRPAPIVRIGETELAIGLDLLEQVRVSES